MEREEIDRIIDAFLKIYTLVEIPRTNSISTLVDFIKDHDINNIYKRIDANCSSKHIPLKEGIKEIFKILEKLNETEFGYFMDGMAKEVKKFIVTNEEQAKALGRTENSTELAKEKDKFDYLLTKYNKMKRKKQISFKFFIIYTILLLIFIIVCFLLVSHTSKGQFNVNVEFNIGEIIGALLAGLGIGAAGIAYAAKTIKEIDKE